MTEELNVGDSIQTRYGGTTYPEVYKVAGVSDTHVWALSESEKSAGYSNPYYIFSLSEVVGPPEPVWEAGKTYAAWEGATPITVLAVDEETGTAWVKWVYTLGLGGKETRLTNKPGSYRKDYKEVGAE